MMAKETKNLVKNPDFASELKFWNVDAGPEVSAGTWGGRTFAKIDKRLRYSAYLGQRIAYPHPLPAGEYEIKCLVWNEGTGSNEMLMGVSIYFADGGGEVVDTGWFKPINDWDRHAFTFTVGREARSMNVHFGVGPRGDETSEGHILITNVELSLKA